MIGAVSNNPMVLIAIDNVCACRSGMALGWLVVPWRELAALIKPDSLPTATDRPAIDERDL